MQVPMVISWFCISVLFSIQTEVLGLDPFSEALLGLKSELVDGSNSLHDWSSANGNSSLTIPACSWSGVTCTKNKSMIVGLDISQRNLSGSLSGKHIKVLADLVDFNISYNSFSGQLPTDVFSLTNLRSLDISRNDFSGPFPDGISAVQNLVVFDAFSNSFSGPLPVEISRLEALKVLNLAGSYFDGPIPKEYGSFKSLEFLHLAGNSLSGEVPPQMGNLKTATHVEIGYNSYTGNIPWQLGNMSRLQYLDMAHANLSGPIPDFLSSLTSLQSLFLFRNQLTGPIPSSFGNMTSLVNLDLSENSLSGSIPKTFVFLKNLRLLSLMYNEMSGLVPDEIAEIPLLDTLLIWNNNFSGNLPQNLGKNLQLKWVDVSTNALTGSVPLQLCAGGKLFKLILFSNRFSSGLSTILSNCSSLVRLRVEDNSFSGLVPLKFDLLPNVTYVDLSRNRFTGGIPTDIYKADNLQYFNISKNPNLGGTIPNGTWSLPLLQNFSASSCNISSVLPVFESCNFVSTLELSENNLSGTIPESIRQCQVLESIDFSNNRLMGHIPLGLASLPALNFIDLSQNKLIGSIPEMFGNSSTLKLFNVSFNNISGSIPPDGVFRSMSESSFIGNPQLCGEPLQRCPNSREIPHVASYGLGGKNSEKLTWVLIVCLGVVLFIMVSIFSALYLHRRKRGQWEMVPFTGLPRFTAKDVLRSLNCSNSMEMAPPALSATIYCKAVLPTGITVAVKKIEWEAKRRDVMSEFIKLIGNARHQNLIRLLGYCSNEQVAYLLYDYLPNGNLDERMKMKMDPAISNWAAKYKIVIGIARGLCYLHHDCYPAIPHGDLRLSNVMFDENMETRLAEFGLKYLTQMNGDSIPRRSGLGTGEAQMEVKEEIYRDVCSFGEVVLEILTNGRLKNGGSLQTKPREVILQEIWNENESGFKDASKEEIKLVLEVIVQCTRTAPADRPSMEDALRILSGLRPNRND